MVKRILFISFFLTCLITVSVSAQEQIKIEPNLEPGKVYNLDTLPRAWFDFVCPCRAIWGRHAAICWFSFGPETSLPGTGIVESEEYMIYVIKGPVILQTNNGERTLHDTECMLLKKGDQCIAATGPDSAEFIEIYWPVMPWVVSMKFWSEKTAPPAAISPSSIPSLPSDSTLCFRKIDKLDLAPNLRGRLVQGERGQLNNVTIPPDAVIASGISKVEEFLYVMRGSLDKTIDGKTVRLNEGDVIYLPVGTVHDAKAGPYGCELLALLTPAITDFTESYERNSKKIYGVISPQEPHIVVDGTKLTPPITGNTEGPSWINNRLYFSDQGAGVYFLNHDGSCRLITDNTRTCGTAPLPNGNLAVCDLTNKRVIEITLEGEIVRVLADTTNGLPHGNPNDLTADAKGGVYVTVNDFTGTLKNSNAIIYLHPGGKIIRLTNYNDIFFPNGIVLSADGKTLFVSSHEKVIWMFDVRDDGSISNKRVFARLVPSDSQIGRENTMSMADGMEIDSKGNLYVATAMVGGIQVFGKTGEYWGTIRIPSTNLVFGGDDLKTLYVTTRGRVYSLKMNVLGIDNTRK